LYAVSAFSVISLPSRIGVVSDGGPTSARLRRSAEETSSALRPRSLASAGLVRAVYSSDFAKFDSNRSAGHWGIRINAVRTHLPRGEHGYFPGAARFDDRFLEQSTRHRRRQASVTGNAAAEKPEDW